MSSGRVLITGAEGRLGQLLSQRLQADGQEVVEVSRNSKSSRIGMDLVQGSAALQQVIERVRPTTVFHTAAVIQGPDPLLHYEANVRMLIHVAEAIGKSSCGKQVTLVNLSSAAELGLVPTEIEFVGEDYPCQPASIYGASKLCQTETALVMGRQFGFRVICPRIFNVIGLPRSADQPVQSWVDQLSLMKKQKAEKKVLLVGDLEVVRDFLDADEVVRLLIQLSRTPAAEGLIHLGSGEATPLRRLVELLRDISGIPFEIQHDPRLPRSVGIKRVVALTTKLNGLVNHEVSHDLRASLSKLLERSA